MRVLVLDDDIKIASSIEKLLQKFFEHDIHHIDVVHNIDDAKQLYQKEKHSILLLDVDLENNQTSFDFIENTKLEEKTKLVFITGHKDYAIKAIKNKAFDYILKPINITEFKETLTNLINHIKLNSKSKTVNDIIDAQNKTLLINGIEAIKMIKVNDIVHFEASGAYTNVVIENQKDILSSKNLKYYETLLSDDGFYRIHNSHLVNVLKIKEINKRDGVTVTLHNNQHIGVSTRKKEDFLIYLKNTIGVE